MAVATVAELKEELAFSGDLGAEDDAMMGRHLEAAQGFLEQSLGFTLAVEFAAPATVPPAIKQAVLWLAVDFYEGRGGSEQGDPLPVHVENIVYAYRDWSF